MLVLLSVVQVGRIALRVARGQGTLSFDVLWQPRTAFFQRLALVGITIAFIVTLRWLGVTLALFLGMLAALYVLGVRKPRVLAGVSFAVAAVVYILFIAVLDSAFPHGPIETALAALFK